MSAFVRRSARRGARGRNPLPSGTLGIGAGLVVNGLATYGFLVISRRALGEDSYSELAVLWGLMYILGLGLFQPLEQELARATADRASRGEGSGPALRQAAQIGGIALIAISALATALWPLGLDHVLSGRAELLLALLVGLAMFAIAELARGVLAGRHEFARYGRYYATEGLSRLTMATVLAIIGVEAVGAFGLAAALGFGFATVAGVGMDRAFVRPGPPSSWRELTPSLGLLLIAALCEAFILNIGPVAVAVLGDELGDEAPGVFLNGLIISRIPLFFFQAVKASLLPNLASLVAHGDLTGFRMMQLKLVAAVLVVGSVAIAGMGLLGPTAVSILFDGDEIGGRDMALLSASAVGVMVMLSIGLGLVALNRYRLAAAGWIASVATFLCSLPLADDPFLQVELALVAGVVVGSIVTAIMLRAALRVASVNR